MIVGLATSMVRKGREKGKEVMIDESDGCSQPYLMHVSAYWALVLTVAMHAEGWGGVRGFELFITF